jgi:hypothetical protein
MEGSFFGAVPGAFSFLGDMLFKWVPGTVISGLNVGPGAGEVPPVFTGTQMPLSAWSVPELLQRSTAPGVYEGLVQGWFVFTVTTLALSIPFAALALYCMIRVVQIRRAALPGVLAYRRTVKAQDIPRTQLRWRRVTEQANGSSPEGWRLAILEADIMLNELLDLQGYRGETIADKMKQASRANFNSIDAAWEAHKVRNRVAHEPAAHELNSREVRRTISLYERVFKEFLFLE